MTIYYHALLIIQSNHIDWKYRDNLMEVQRFLCESFNKIRFIVLFQADFVNKLFQSQNICNVLCLLIRSETNPATEKSQNGGGPETDDFAHIPSSVELRGLKGDQAEKGTSQVVGPPI